MQINKRNPSHKQNERQKPRDYLSKIREGLQQNSTTFMLNTLNKLGINGMYTYACIYLYKRMIYIPLGIYPVMGLLGQMVFLVLGL